jgi:hypothetical protein
VPPLRRRARARHISGEAAETVVTRVRGRQHGLLARKSGDEILLLDTKADQIHQLNMSASFIWDRLEEGFCDEEIARLLAIEFDVVDYVAQADVTAAVAQFRVLGFIT